MEAEKIITSEQIKKTTKMADVLKPE